MDGHFFVIKAVAYSLRTDRQTHTGTDTSLKTEVPEILSNGIFYFRTVIIGGPIQVGPGRAYINSTDDFTVTAM